MKKTILLLAVSACFALTSKAQSTSPAPYCDASFDDQQGFPVDDHINSVSFGTLNNATNAQFAAPHYVHYNNLAVANFNAGTTYKLKLNFEVAGGNGYGVWIDFNHNNAFEANEKVAGTTGMNFLPLGQGIADSANVTIPTTAVAGNTRMRVRIVEDDNHHMTTTDELPCNASTSTTDVMDWGETEDYTINIVSSTAVNEVVASNSIYIFPNPITDLITIDSKNEINDYRILNLFGQVIKEGNLITNKSIDASDLSKGIYFIELNDTKNKLSIKRKIVMQ